MKKILFVLTAFSAIIFLTPSVNTVSAQSSAKVTKAAVTAADTTSYASIRSKVKSFHFTVTKSAGTLAGKMYLEATDVGASNTEWIKLDSLSITDISTVQQKAYVVPPTTGTSYLSYRFRYAPTGGTATLILGYVRRIDE